MSNATVMSVDHSGVDPRISAAEHARQQADVLHGDLGRQRDRVLDQTAKLEALLDASIAAWQAADTEARRLEAIAKEI